MILNDIGPRTISALERIGVEFEHHGDNTWLFNIPGHVCRESRIYIGQLHATFTNDIANAIKLRCPHCGLYRFYNVPFDHRCD